MRHLRSGNEHDHEGQDELANSDEQFCHDAGKSTAADKDFHSCRHNAAIEESITDAADEAGNISNGQIVGNGYT